MVLCVNLNGWIITHVNLNRGNVFKGHIAPTSSSWVLSWNPAVMLLRKSTQPHGEPRSKRYNCQRKLRSQLTACTGLLPIPVPAWHSVQQETALASASSSRKWAGGRERGTLTMYAAVWVLQSDPQTAFTSKINLPEHLHSSVMCQNTGAARGQRAAWPAQATRACHFPRSLAASQAARPFPPAQQQTHEFFMGTALVFIEHKMLQQSSSSD